VRCLAAHGSDLLHLLSRAIGEVAGIGVFMLAIGGLVGAAVAGVASLCGDGLDLVLLVRLKR